MFDASYHKHCFSIRVPSKEITSSQAPRENVIAIPMLQYFKDLSTALEVTINPKPIAFDVPIQSVVAR